ncbi:MULTISPECIES: 3-phosphoserine/phosphohydroxythreonine transaminase [Shewanella]|uniref:3-phosphoserine/phosphohydroxythreonine transaminase n=1 Tax=Shewanella TaxID=22 RepID=UPI00167335D2|nr:3-phosphoserine/phosphohydroxythreonine transaminase [Shewanella fodinae]MBO1270288.1 3-phosphoserine/phosphohydroxythreonine transaminase [Shewanella sp. 4t3-1-2LB]MCL2905572.1 3-phosphoserine/phosphohydroxythreonine transaminase [Shewanella fodinae]GGY92101.1 phosphoserine aminotransferase [Shewanella fodinae]
MSTVYNFCAGPAMLPPPVMAKAQAELLDWQGQGVSVMEVSHRGAPFIALAKASEADLRELMNIPDNYHVLFMHGGGRGQFAAVVNNFLGNNGKALYLLSGQWSKSAADEAVRLVGEAQIDTIEMVSKVNGLNQVTLPELNGPTTQYRYVHYCPNETVDGIEIFEEIDAPWPVIADMSSTIMSRQVDVSKFGMIYAGAQKNIGPSGLSIVIVRKDLLQLPPVNPSSIMDYRIAAAHDSMFNTPPTFAWYLAAEVFKWLQQLGGVAAIETQNKQKAELLYQCIDELAFYKNGVAPQNRSRMNVTFQLQDEALNKDFLADAEALGLVALKGHRIVGGMRASIYNAMPLAGVQKLVDFMRAFAEKHTA